MIDASEFRRVLGHFPTGVTVVTSRRPGGEPCGMTVNAFCSVSLEPPLVLVCIERDAASHECFEAAGAYAVNVLEGEAGERLSRRFSAWNLEDKFDGVPYHAEVTGSPVLGDALAWVDCRILDAIPAGDHTVLIGEVLAGDAHEGEPLVYYRGGYGRFQP